MEGRKTTDEQREGEVEFSTLLRQKARSGRPTIEDLTDRGREEPEAAEAAEGEDHEG